MDFLFQESLLYTSIPTRRNVSARISLRGLRRLILVDILRRVHIVGFLVERLIYIDQTLRTHRMIYICTVQQSERVHFFIHCLKPKLMVITFNTR